VTSAEPSNSRREEYAEVTRQAVVAAARELFAQNGYSSTTVQQIARRARVSPATVYAQCGGKQGLLETLMDQWTAGALVGEIIDDCAAADTGKQKLEVLADGYMKIYKTSGDIIRIVGDAAASAPTAASFMETANERHLQALLEIIEQLRATGELADGLSDQDVANIVLFHFRYEQFLLAAFEFGWGETRALDWIRGRVEAAILKP
jgi:AcrR family transcriptional regulator